MEVKKLPLDSQAGESFSYNQTNYGLLAKIITSQTKMPFEQFFAERQFKVALISEVRVRQMWTPEKLNNGEEGGWGTGWAIVESSPERKVAGIGGGRSAFVVYPDRGLAIVVLTNLVGANPENFIPQIAQIHE